MKYIKEPKKVTAADQKKLRATVADIIDQVVNQGDKGLKELIKKFDGSSREDYFVSKEEIVVAYEQVDDELIEAMKVSMANIEKFAKLELDANQAVPETEVSPGVFLGARKIPVDSTLCYVPGGNHPLFSTALMLAVPARVAGVPRIAAAAPPMKGSNSIHPATLVALDLAGVEEIAVMGGAQAIAAFAYGTDQVDPVAMIVGPGNQFVTEAKRQAYGQVGIDFIAGPSEVLVLADASANPAVIAADLLAQAEHDLNARAALISTSEDLLVAVEKEVERQLEALPTKDIAAVSWADNGSLIFAEDMDEAIDLTNDWAAEHLEVMVEGDFDYERLRNYGSLFIGQYTAEVFGDYTSGTNHTLPTAGAARYTGGLDVTTFIKTISYQRLDKEGFDRLKESTKTMAENEGLIAHYRAVSTREDEFN